MGGLKRPFTIPAGPVCKLPANPSRGCRARTDLLDAAGPLPSYRATSLPPAHPTFLAVPDSNPERQASATTSNIES